MYEGICECFKVIEVLFIYVVIDKEGKFCLILCENNLELDEVLVLLEIS